MFVIASSDDPVIAIIEATNESQFSNHRLDRVAALAKTVGRNGSRRYAREYGWEERIVSLMSRRRLGDIGRVAMLAKTTVRYRANFNTCDDNGEEPGIRRASPHAVFARNEVTKQSIHSCYP